MERAEATVLELFRRLRTLPEGEEYYSIRAELAARHERLVTAVASRYRDKGEPLDDLIQVGRVALLHAIDRYDPNRGVRFTTYAMETISGEIKRYFRDRGWGLRVPRRLQELNIAARRASEALAQELGRSPTIAEVAAAVGRSEEETLEALEIGQQAYELASLDDLLDQNDEGSNSVSDRVAQQESPIADFRALAEIKLALAQLNPRLRSIVVWKFVEGYSQSEIAKRLGISQMHVSRLQARAVQELRRLLGQECRDG